MTNNFTKAVNSFIDKIHCRKTYLRKSTMTTGNAYLVTLTYKGKRCSFVFHDNFRNARRKKTFFIAYTWTLKLSIIMSIFTTSLIHLATNNVGTQKRRMKAVASNLNAYTSYSQKKKSHF